MNEILLRFSVKPQVCGIVLYAARRSRRGLRRTESTAFPAAKRCI